MEKNILEISGRYRGEILLGFTVLLGLDAPPPPQKKKKKKMGGGGMKVSSQLR